MKLLADANVEAALVQWLREAGHDVIWGVELPPGTDDQTILSLAMGEQRAILTHDLDFGELVFKSHLLTQSILLMRFTSRQQSERLRRLKAWWPSVEPLLGRATFIVVSDDSIRSRPLPGRHPDQAGGLSD